MKDKNIKQQQAGNSSVQIQSDQINQQINNYYTGVTPEQAKLIARQEAENVIALFGEVAKEKADERFAKFEDKLFNKIDEVKASLEPLKKPELRIFLSEICKSAIQTDSIADYDLLSELLVKRLQHDNDREICSALKIAVQIVPEIDDAALLALTMYYCILEIYIESTNFKNILEVLNKLYGKIHYMNYPKNQNWIEHLELLKCIKTINFYSPIKYLDVFSKRYSSFFEVGINSESENFKKARELLLQEKLPSNLLINHEFNEGYYRLDVLREEDIDKQLVLIKSFNCWIILNDSRKKALREIYNMYEKNIQISKKIRNKILDTLSSYPKIKETADWFNNIPIHIGLTSIGRVIANANSRLYEHAIPKHEIDSEKR